MSETPRYPPVGRKLRGPPVFSNEAIHDIVTRRHEKNALRSLMEKYDVTANRIYTIWKSYYGGKTLADAAGGLIRPLPSKQTNTVEVAPGVRMVKTDKFTLKATPPTPRAKVQKVIPPTKTIVETPNEDLTPDAEAELVSGAIQAGNDNEQLINQMYELMNTNTQLSQHAIQALKHAEKFYKKNKNKRSTYEYSATDDEAKPPSSLGYDSTKCDQVQAETDDEYTTDDGNDAGWSDQRLPSRGNAGGGQYVEFSGQGYEESDNGDFYEPDQRVSRIYSNVQPPRPSKTPISDASRGHTARAQPIHKFGGERPEQGAENTGAQQPNQTSAKISAPQQYAAPSPVQHNSALYRYKLGS